MPSPPPPPPPRPRLLPPPPPPPPPPGRRAPPPVWREASSGRGRPEVVLRRPDASAASTSPSPVISSVYIYSTYLIYI